MQINMQYQFIMRSCDHTINQRKRPYIFTSTRLLGSGNFYFRPLGVVYPAPPKRGTPGFAAAKLENKNRICGLDIGLLCFGCWWRLWPRGRLLHMRARRTMMTDIMVLMWRVATAKRATRARRALLLIGITLQSQALHHHRPLPPHHHQHPRQVPYRRRCQLQKGG